MDENQPLLTCSNKSSDDDNNQSNKSTRSSLFTKCPWIFYLRKKNPKDENDAIDNTNNPSIIRFIRLDINYFDTNPAGILNRKLFDNINIINKGIGFELSALIGTISCSIISIIVCFFISWKLTSVMICTIPFVFLGLQIFSKMTNNEAQNELISYSKADQIVQVFSSIRTVLSLNGGNFELERYKISLLDTAMSSILGFIFSSIILYNDNELNISDILVVISVFAQGISVFAYIGPFIQSALEARTAATSIFQIIDQREEFQNAKSININGHIQFKNVNFNYPSRKDVTVLNNLNLMIQNGKKTAIVGESGSGKSTCISLLLHYYDPSSGEILINGQSISEYDIKQLRLNIGVVNQDPILFSTTIYENISYGKENSTKYQIEQAARQANAHDFIMKLPNKYSTLVGEAGIQLSFGEKQRIALARALVRQPQLLLLDEATSGLDCQNEYIIQQALNNICKDRTTVIVAHRLTTIQNADYIYVLDHGCVLEQGTHSLLMEIENGKYRNMFNIQQIEIQADRQDEIYPTQQEIIEDKQQIMDKEEYSASIIVNQKYSSSNRLSIFLRLLSMNKPEWIIMMIGSIACLANGFIQPIFALLLTDIVQKLNNFNDEERRTQVIHSSLWLLCLGFGSFFIRFFQFTAFSVAGSKLTERIRTKAFASLLRQEVAYFDQSENSSGAICHRLSSDALSIQQITSTRLGYICETLAMFMLGIIFGFLFNYQFSLIVLFMLFIVAAFTYLNIIFEMRLHKKCGNILRQASSISVEVLHNMRTVKLLSMEERFVKQYSDLIHRCCVIRDMGASLSAAQNFFNLFDRVPSIDNSSTEGKTLVNDLGDIQFDHVKFSYPCRPTSTVVNILKLIIKSGQKVAFHDNIQYGSPNLTLDQIINAAKKANIHNFFQELPQGYQTNVGIKGNQLSGGEKQRIAIARAIIREPNLLIFDEATSDLDSYNEQIVQQTLEHIQIENPLQTTITIAHRLGTIRSCHQIYVIDKGHIIESGSHEELIQRRSRYYQMILLNRLQ
ncbi:unnamed protein product [Rotaria magnacalcarata]|uniref:Uncharacterized protein n=2 Tax=Rotaria magnacalcarata TaxID=392030 RepID=A0A816UE82_9BILA|nr:unnamed protein product [Rotaria magnacalcarata]